MTPSLRGFLRVPEPGAAPILTAGQKDLVLQALIAVLDPDRDAQTLFEVGRSLGMYPTDRSCRSCDHLAAGSGHCRLWEQEVPREHLAAGCDAWRDEGHPI